jgi:hypothetical protein
MTGRYWLIWKHADGFILTSRVDCGEGDLNWVWYIPLPTAKFTPLGSHMITGCIGGAPPRQPNNLVENPIT